MEYLVKEGLLPPCFLGLGTRPDESTNEGIKEATELLKEAINGVKRSTGMLENAVASLKDAEIELKAALEKNEQLGRKVDRLGELLVIVGIANLFIVVLVLLVLLVK